jgi:hypothetical protein
MLISNTTKYSVKKSHSYETSQLVICMLFEELGHCGVASAAQYDKKPTQSESIQLDKRQGEQ